MTQNTTRYTLFYLLYGHEAILPLEYSLPTYQLNNTPPLDEPDWIKCRVESLEHKLNKA